LQHPSDVAGGIVIWVAAAGILVNGIMALLFLSGRKGDLNIRGAFVHMAGDAGIAVGVVLAGIAILVTGLRWIDPVVSLAIVAIILHSTWGLLRDSVNLALDAVPEGIAIDEVRSYLEGLPDVTAVRDLHIWAMSTTGSVSSTRRCSWNPATPRIRALARRSAPCSGGWQRSRHFDSADDGSAHRRFATLETWTIPG